ncbi:MAG TPA: response regulator transcription factor [Acidimicrobiales bacterium]|nr:response regulator transcription factor [Acidimicrobiales bacterium]
MTETTLPTRIDARPGACILVVEDDGDIWRSVEILLRRNGYRPVWAADGTEGLRLLRERSPDLVVLDVGLPKVDGWAVLERIRDHSDVPVILLTARGLETDKVRGLLGGADDYLTKPFSNDELVARVGALLRRSPPTGPVPSVVDDGHVRMDLAHHRVEVGGRDVALTPSEFRLLAALVRHTGQVLSHGQLLELAWHDPTRTGPGRVKFTVLSLRRKLGWTDLATSPIETVRGFGYRYRHPSR